jgi:hypothetical protein
MKMNKVMKLCVLISATSATEKTYDPDEIIDARYLFTATSELHWEYGGKAYKCCVSSAGKPTMIQDMKVKELPNVGTWFSSKTGCGAMFGDTYHNGPKGYLRTGNHSGDVRARIDPSCPLPAKNIADIVQCESPADSTLADFREGYDVFWTSEDEKVPAQMSGKVIAFYQSRQDNTERVLVKFGQNKNMDYLPHELFKVGTSACEAVNIVKREGDLPVPVERAEL